MMRRLFLFLASIGLAAQAAAVDTADPVGRKIDGFSLRDFRGKTHTLDDYQDKQLVVVLFLGCDCPIAKQYAPRLRKLAEEYGPRGVAFLGIDANSQDTLTELAAYAQAGQIEFPLLKDAGNQVADQFSAERTPEAFVLDRDRKICYRGRIDDQFLVGKQRPEPTRRDLAVALDEMLSDKAVTVATTEAVGCRIGRVPKRQQHGDVTYSNQISRLLSQRCIECHRQGEIAPFPLTDYEEAAGWAETMQEVVHQGRMPPWFASDEHGKFANDARLSDDEKRLLDDWIAAGCPEGDPSQLPEPRQFTVGWQIPQPDQIVYIRDEPVHVQAEGTVAYQYFSVDPGFKEDKWIRAAECRPDNRSVVHHIVAFFVPPGEKLRDGARGAMVGYAPGMPPNRFDDGSAMFVPAGSRVVFQMHYTPNGSEQVDRSSMGLVFADPATVKMRVSGGMAANRYFTIPAGNGNFEVRSHHKFDKDVRLVTMTPHMHLRGKAFRYEAEYPDGRREVLLDIPHYDFNWQLRYRLVAPLLMPKGTNLVCIAHFDNSTDNLANPDPTKPVRWGDQTWEEMMIGYFSTLPIEPDVHASVESSGAN
ncbi:MAG TPA: redoxin domain-containing protein [Pirellulales bacterium]|nr:redoxin domain-containing protein [Pirellulales bacterium]